MTADISLERRIAEEIGREVGPPRQVDASAIARGARNRNGSWRDRMMGGLKLVATAAVLAVAGAFVIAVRPSGPSSGGIADAPAATDAGPAAYVHGTFRGISCCGDEVETFDDAGARLTLRGMMGTGTSEMDDPRLSGDYTLTVSIDEFPQEGASVRVEVGWGELLIENADGTWRGPWTSTWDSAATSDTELVLYTLTGDGAYEGMAALLSPTKQGWPLSTLAGSIFPGPLPPR